MKATEFWKLYQEEYKRYECPGFALRDYPLTGDHGCFEMSIYKNNDDVWCIDRTIERSNTPSRMWFASEDEAFEYLLKQVESYVAFNKRRENQHK